MKCIFGSRSYALSAQRGGAVFFACAGPGIAFRAPGGGVGAFEEWKRGIGRRGRESLPDAYRGGSRGASAADSIHGVVAAQQQPCLCIQLATDTASVRPAEFRDLFAEPSCGAE